MSLFVTLKIILSVDNKLKNIKVKIILNDQNKPQSPINQNF